MWLFRVALLGVAMIWLLAPIGGSVAQESGDAAGIEAALTAARTRLLLVADELGGEGGELLRREIAASRFVLIGENHLTREVPQFALAVCAAMQPDAYAVEAGPLAAKFVGGQLRDPEREAHMRARLSRFPGSMEFLEVREENELAARCAASSRKPGFALWGLDQEFLGAGGALLEAMLETRPGARSVAALHVAQAEEQAAERRASGTGDFMQLYLPGVSDAALKKLAAAVDEDGTPATKQLLHELQESRAIYRLHVQGSPESNRRRIQLLKQHFVADYLPLRVQKSDGRVLFKFGSVHMGRGFDPLHQLNLGNTVAEAADVEGVRSLHILVMGAAGTAGVMRGYRKPLGAETFRLSEDPDAKWLQPALAAMLPTGSGEGARTLTLFDLRRLRFGKEKLAPEWEQLIYSYDLLVMIPEVTPETAIVAGP